MLIESVPCEAAGGVCVSPQLSPDVTPPRGDVREPADGSSRRKLDHPFADDVPELAAVGVAGAGAGGTRDGNPTSPHPLSVIFIF